MRDELMITPKPDIPFAKWNSPARIFGGCVFADSQEEEESEHG
jgi:hypothetical protein